MVYVAPGPLAARLSYHTRQSVKGEVKYKLEFLFPCSEIKSGTKRKNVNSNQPSASKKRKVLAKSSKAKGKLKAVEPDEGDPANILPEDISFLTDDEVPSQKILHKYLPDDDDELPEAEDIPFLTDDEVPSQKILHKYLPGDDNECIDLNVSDDDDNTNNFAWSRSFLEEPRARFKPSIKKQTKTNQSRMNNGQENDNEVIMLSSD